MRHWGGGETPKTPIKNASAGAANTTLVHDYLTRRGTTSRSRGAAAVSAKGAPFRAAATTPRPASIGEAWREAGLPEE
jgi:hypothetical protein